MSECWLQADPWHFTPAQNSFFPSIHTSSWNASSPSATLCSRGPSPNLCHRLDSHRPHRLACLNKRLLALCSSSGRMLLCYLLLLTWSPFVVPRPHISSQKPYIPLTSSSSSLFFKDNPNVSHVGSAHIPLLTAGKLSPSPPCSGKGPWTCLYYKDQNLPGRTPGHRSLLELPGRNAGMAGGRNAGIV